jgi:hypothetical protein
MLVVVEKWGTRAAGPKRKRDWRITEGMGDK